ncbi:MAG: hypothetical protein ACLPYB_05765 [Desulfobaccales bacterium]
MLDIKTNDDHSSNDITKFFATDGNLWNAGAVLARRLQDSAALFAALGGGWRKADSQMVEN